MPFLRDLFTQLAELFAQQSRMKKLIAGAILLAAVAFGVTQLLKYGKKVEYQELYAGLDAQTAKAVTDSLKTTAPGLPFDVTQNDRGWTVRVPADRALELRLDLAPNIETGTGRVGWELFDKTSIGITDFTQKINRQRAVQGELARTIQSIDVVKTANVTLAMPEESVFVSEELKPKASVLVELYPKSTLSKNKVEAIQALVAGSIEGLTRDNVTVADTTGRLLSRPKGEGDNEADLDERGMLVEQQQKQRKSYEDYLQQKIEDSLSKVFGPKHISAQVNVDFDFTQKEVSELKYSPKNVPIAESVSRTEGYSNTQTPPGGVAGSPAHLPPEGMTSSTAGGTRTAPVSSEEKVTNYNVGKTETKTVYPPYQVRRVTAAVLVDDMPQTDDKGTVVRKKLTPEQITALENQVKQIISFSEERPGGSADVITVSNMTFRMPEELSPEQTATKLQTQRLVMIGVKYGLLALLALFVLIFLVRPLVTVIAPRPALQPALAGGRDATLLGMGDEQSLLEGPAGQTALSGALQAAGALPQPAETDGAGARQTELDNEILELAKENPKKVAMVLRAWIES